MQQKTITRKTLRPPADYLQADEPSSVGGLWLTAAALLVFWAGVVFSIDALVSLWLA